MNDPLVAERVRGYAPYEQVSAQNYPALFVTAGYHDMRVQYWEAAKWVAKLRHCKTDSRPLLLRTQMSAGHGGASGRYQAIRELADMNNVPVLQYPELARAIYFTSRTGQIVDEALYMAVATVLAFVFRMENRMASEMDRPFITVPDELRFNADGKKVE